MPRQLQMPTEEELPPGAKRDFVAELFVHFRDANRPPLNELVNTITGPLKARSVSRETIRRLFKGKTTSDWRTVETLLRALCHLSGRDPNSQRFDDRYDDDNDSCRTNLHRLWHNTFDGAGLDAQALPPLPHSHVDRTVAAPSPQLRGFGATSVPRQTGGWGMPTASPQDDPWAQPNASAKTTFPDEPPF